MADSEMLCTMESSTENSGNRGLGVVAEAEDMRLA